MPYHGHAFSRLVKHWTRQGGSILSFVWARPSGPCPHRLQEPWLQPTTESDLSPLCLNWLSGVPLHLRALDSTHGYHFKKHTPASFFNIYLRSSPLPYWQASRSKSRHFALFARCEKMELWLRQKRFKKKKKLWKYPRLITSIFPYWHSFFKHWFALWFILLLLILLWRPPMTIRCLFECLLVYPRSLCSTNLVVKIPSLIVYPFECSPGSSTIYLFTNLLYQSSSRVVSPFKCSPGLPSIYLFC